MLRIMANILTCLTSVKLSTNITIKYNITMQNYIVNLSFDTYYYIALDSIKIMFIYYRVFTKCR